MASGNPYYDQYFDPGHPGNRATPVTTHDPSGPPLNGLSGNATNNLNIAIPALGNSVDKSGARADTLFKEGDSIFGNLQKYLEPRLNGDRQSLMEAAAPEITGITDQYDSAFKAANALNPRAGGKVSAFTKLRADEAGAVQGTLNKERSSAATTEAGLFSQISGLATSSSAQSQQSLTSLISALLGKQGADSAASAQLGSSIGSIFGAALAFL